MNWPGSASIPSGSSARPRGSGRKSRRTNATSSSRSPLRRRTLYLGLDGTGAPVRKDAARGRRGKQPDGSAKTREAKIAAVWSAETPDKDGSPIRDPHSASYNAAIETAASRDTDPIPAPFTRRVLRESERRRFDQAPRSVILGDGAAWIWRLADEHFPEAIQVVDIFHAKGHLFDAAKAVYGAGSDLARQWGKQRRDELDQGRISDILAALRDHAGTCEEAKKCIDYIANNRSRMQYPKFRAMGLCVATGVVEGGCKNVVGSRLKRGGMPLDRQRRQRHHRAALRHSEQPLRRLLGATRNRRMTEISQICRAPGMQYVAGQKQGCDQSMLVSLKEIARISGESAKKPWFVCMVCASYFRLWICIIHHDLQHLLEEIWLLKSLSLCPPPKSPK